MFDEDLKALWKRGEATMPPLTPVAIENLLRPTARRSGRSLEFLAWTHVAMLAFTALLAFVNVYGYRDNPTMLAVEAALAAVSVSFTLLGARLIAGLRRIARADLPLVQMVEQQLSFTEPLVSAVDSRGNRDAMAARAGHQHGRGQPAGPLHHQPPVGVRRRDRGDARDHLRLAEALDRHDGARAARGAARPPRGGDRRHAAARGHAARSRRWMAVGVVLLSLAVLLGVALWLKLL